MTNISRRGFVSLPAAAALLLMACGKRDPRTTHAPSEPLFTYRFASAEEGKDLVVSNTDFVDNLNQADLDYRMQKKGATLEEWKEFAADQVLEFTDEERQLVSECWAELEWMIEERGVKLPPSDEIVFVKTTGQEEGAGVAAYTHGTQIYLAEIMMDFFKSDNQEERDWSISLLAHELFHCLTRSNPGFRASMYSIIHFDVQDADYELGPDVTERMITNPDVEHHNSSALFTINGEQRRCAVVFYAKQPFENPGDTFFDRGGTGLVPVDDLNTLIDSSEASDFWDLFGHNTDYVIDPEETMADNFSFAVVYGRDGQYYETPEIIDQILELLTP